MHGAHRDKYITKTKNIFIKYYGSYNDNYKGFDYINELPKFEDTFEYGINIIKYKSDESWISLSYITDIDKLAKMYICNNCAAKFRDNEKLTRHNNTCESGTVNTFEYDDKIWTKPRNIIIEICAYYNIPNTDFKYDL